MRKINTPITYIIAIILFAGCNNSQHVAQRPDGMSVIIYTKENRPVAPAVSELPLQDSIARYGITWKFNKKYPSENSLRAIIMSSAP